MSAIRFLYFIATILVVAKSSAEADDVSLLAQSLVESKHITRGSDSGSIDEKESEEKDEEISVNRSPKRMLEAGTKRLLQLISINIGCCDDDDDDNYDDEGDDNYDDDDDNDKDFVASDGNVEDEFGSSCSMSNDLVVVGAVGDDDHRGAAYLFHMDGTEVAKLTPGYDGEEDDWFGTSVSMDEKIIVGTGYYGGYVRVFSRSGTYERTITCEGCTNFGHDVATLGNLIVTDGTQNSIEKLFIHSTEGELEKEIEQEDAMNDVAISEQFIASTSWTGGKTIIYSNTSPDFPKIAEINQAGNSVAVSNERLVIATPWANDWNGTAYLYNTNGTLVTALDRQDASSGSDFGSSVAITDDKVFVGAPYDGDDQDYYYSGSVFIYSAVTGEFIEKVSAPDGEASDHFGMSVCASGSYYVVGATGVDWNTGAAYLFQLP